LAIQLEYGSDGWLPSLTSLEKPPMQIAGNQCKVCGHSIILSTEGKFCARCRIFVHLRCVPHEICDVCGEPFEHDQPPESDPLRDAILPRSLRPFRAGGSLVAAVLILFVVFLFFIIRYGFIRMLGS
jgi:predicted nucleic acid-binding Zn ribbon protein